MSDGAVTERFQNRLDGDYVDELIERLSEPGVLVSYRAKNFSLDQERIRPTMIPLHGRTPVLVEADGTTSAKHDAKNAKLVHKYLGSITPEQAADFANEHGWPALCRVGRARHSGRRRHGSVESDRPSGARCLATQ